MPGPTPGKPPSEYRITAHAAADGPATAEAASAHIGLDVGWARPPTGQPGPAELLASAFAACLLKNLARTRDLVGFQYERADVEVVARRQDAPPKFVEISYTVTVTTDEPERRVELAHKNLVRYGTVFNTLAAVCDVHGVMNAVPTLPTRAG